MYVCICIYMYIYIYIYIYIYMCVCVCVCVCVQFIHKTVAVSPSLLQDLGRVSYHVDVPKAAIATLARVSEVVSV